MTIYNNNGLLHHQKPAWIINTNQHGILIKGEKLIIIGLLIFKEDTVEPVCQVHGAVGQVGH